LKICQNNLIFYAKKKMFQDLQLFQEIQLV